MNLYKGKAFVIDVDQNLVFDTSKEGIFKARITQDMNENYAYLDVEMVTQNKPPVFPEPINNNHTVSLVKGIDGEIEDLSVYSYTSTMAKDYEGDDVTMIFKGSTEAIFLTQNKDDTFTLRVNRGLLKHERRKFAVTV